MDNIQIKLICLIVILTLTVITLVWALIILDNRYSAFVDAYMERVRSHYKFSDEILKYCLGVIIVQSVSEEKYEIAKSAKELLDKVISDEVNRKAI